LILLIEDELEDEEEEEDEKQQHKIDKVEPLCSGLGLDFLCLFFEQVRLLCPSSKHTEHGIFHIFFTN